jgi:integrase
MEEFFNFGIKGSKKREPKKLPVAIDEAEFYELIRKTKKKHHKIAFLLGFGSGLRVSEIIKLEPRDINFNEGKILIRQAKGGKDRFVPLPKGLKPNHLEYIPLKCGVRALEIAFRRTAKRSGLLKIKPTAHFHSLRHGFASNSVKKGIPIHHIRTMMGHTNISTTNVYLEMNPTEALKAYEELF